MAINKNHEFEELNGVKCAIVEKSISPERAKFLEELLQLNGYTVVVVPAAPTKTAPAKAAETEVEAEATPPPPVLYIVGVTDITFNSINAVFGRMLKTGDGRVVTLAYWQQKETVSQDEVPYFEKKI